MNEELVLVNGEMKESLDSLARANADLNNLISATDVATLFLDRSLRIKRYTPRACESFTVIPGDVGRLLAHVTHTLQYPELIDDATKVASGKPSARREVESASGATYLVHMAPSDAGDGTADGVIINLIDVTERREAEQSARGLSAVVASSEDSIFSVSLQGDLSSWNRGAEQMLGHAAEETIGQSLQRLRLSSEHARIAAAIEQVVLGQPVAVQDMEWLRKDGSRLDVSASYSPIADKHGGIAGVTIVARDITADRQQAASLRESELRLRRATEIETVGMLYFTMDGRLIQANPAICRMSGMREEEWHTAWQSGEAEACLPGWSRVHDDVQKSGTAHPREMKWSRSGGDEWWALLTATRLSELEAVAVVVDITDQKRAVAALRESNHRKDEFLATLAHELRNSLAPIRNALAIFTATRGSDSTAETALRIMDRQLKQLVRLVDDLLDLSRISRGTIELRTQPVDIASILQEAVDAAATVFESDEVRLVLQQSPEPITVHGDPERLMQMFGHLLSNACTFSQVGGEVTVEAARVDPSVVVRVRALGEGINPADLDRVFEMFVPADTNRPHSSNGLGIGLTLVRELAQLHHGTVEAHSEGRGEGAEFVLTLQLADTATAGAAL